MTGSTHGCPSCGAENRATSKFCSECGSKLTAEVTCPGCGATHPAGKKFCDECGASLAAAAGAPTGGTAPALPPRLGDRYEATRLLGEGGRKRVYLATDERLNREVALALFKSEGADETSVQRARREAESMAKLGDHPNVVNVYDLGEEHGVLYLVSQYMRGGDLEGLAEQADDRRLAVREAIRIGREIASALEHAHAHGVLHRDVKPQNIWLGPDGTAKLGDFGLAMADDMSRLTADGAMVGTVAYMPPELGLGRPAEPRSDIYSLGAVIYELLCGVPPFVGDDAASVISQHVSATPVGPTWHRDDVPQALEQLVLEMLAKTVEERPASAAEVRATLDAIVAAGPEAVAGPGADERAMERLSEGTLLGRDAESKKLRAALDEALAQRGRLVLLGGEAGIGKTRLAADLETYAELRGAQVLWGRCHQREGAPAYWPWVQAIRAYVHDRDPGELASELGSGASEVAQIVSELRERIPDLPEPQPLDPEQARFRMLDAVSSFLVNAARRQPLAIFFDDLHLADKPSLMLLEFLAGQLGSARLFVLGTYRDDDPEHKLPSNVTAGLRRERGCTELKLRGLGEAQVKAMLENALHQTLASPSELALVDAVFRESEGNPYFIEEMTRHLIDAGALARDGDRWDVDVERIGGESGIAQGIRETVGQRLASLSDEARELLSVAAAIGREFDLDILVRVTTHEAAVVIEQLQEAIRKGSVRTSQTSRGGYEFSQAATRDSLYDELPGSRRASLHKAIGEALEERYDDRIESHLGELAYHFAEAVPAEDPAKGADYAWWAGERAAALYAYEDAAAHFTTALRLFEMADDDQTRRCEILLNLGDVRWRAGDTDRAKRTFLEAADIARKLVLDQQFARAALGYGLGPGGFAVTDHADSKLIELLRAALDLLPPRDSTLRVRVMARLAVELASVGDPSQPDALSREAVEMAERVGDTKILMLAIYSRQWSMTGPDAIDESLAASDEIIRLARLSRDRDMEFAGHHLRLIALIQLGRMTDVDAEIDACDRLAQDLHQPNYLWWASVFRAMRAVFQGRFEESDRLAQAALKLGTRWHEEIPLVAFGAQAFLIRWGEGKLDELVDPGRQFAQKYGQAWRTAFVWLLTETDNLDEARDRFRQLAATDFEALRWNTDWMTAMCALALAAVALEERSAAEVLYEQFAPYADRCAAFLAGSGSLGSNHAFVGFAAKAAGRLDEAISHFDEALARNSAMGAEYLTARIQYERARALLERGADGDVTSAEAAVEAGLAAARALGMPKEVKRLMSIRLERRGLTDVDVMTSIDHVQIEVAQERPDLSPVAAPDGTVTIMFSDIEDSTVLTDRLGDHRWMELLHYHDGVVRRQVAEHGGFEVKSQGDGFMLAFGSARAAINCAIAIQRELEAYRSDGPPVPLKVRVGLHTGEVLRERDDFFGRNVVLAARIAANATGNEILVSGLLREVVASGQEFAFEDERELELKGLPGTHCICRVRWSESPVPTAAAP